MLGPILAAIIIILLIIYAAFPFLSSKNFRGWPNIILTAVILFTVIVLLFVILGHGRGNRLSFKSIPNLTKEQTVNEEQVKEEAKQKEEETNGTVKAEENQNEEQTKAENTQVEPQEMTDEEALIAITKEYLEAEEAFKANGDKDYQQKAAQQIIDKYDFTQEDWQTYLEDAARYDLFNKVKAEIK